MAAERHLGGDPARGGRVGRAEAGGADGDRGRDPGGPDLHRIAGDGALQRCHQAADPRVRGAGDAGDDPADGGVTPPRGGQGETLDVTIDGANFQAGATVRLRAGVAVTAVTVVSDREIVATLDIPLNATLGPRTVTVTNPDATSVSRAGAFTVTLPPPARVPRLERQGAGPGRADRRAGSAGRPAGRDADGDGDGRRPDGDAARAGGDRRRRGRLDTIPANSLWVLGAALHPDLARSSTPPTARSASRWRTAGASRSSAPTGSRASSCRGRR